jgi:cytochrome c biogenesis protein CcdA
MDPLQALWSLGSGPVPVVAAFFIGLLTAVSPCPLATNITAIAYLSRRIGNSRHTLLAGTVYTLGRMAAYITVAAAIVAFGMNVQAIALPLQHFGERLIGPFLVLCGIYLLGLFQFIRLPGSDRLRAAASGISSRLAQEGYLGAFLLGVIFALSFCPFSAVLFFAMLIPLALAAGDPVVIPAVFAIATGIPVIIIAFLLTKGAGSCSRFFNRARGLEVWLRTGAALVFIGAGLYLTFTFYRSGTW